LLFVPARFEIPTLVLTVVGPLVGWVLPRLYVQNRAAGRTAEIEAALPDMLDMLTMCVSQGLTVPQALDRIGRELRLVHSELARELSIIAEQAKIGTLRHGLENFSRRIDLPEIHAFTSLVIQTDRLGTSVAAALIEYSDTMRETLRQRADQKANQAAFKLLFPTVLCLMPAVYMILLGPATIELSNFFHNGGLQAVERGTDAVEQLNQRLP
jgi:tight adherence protein C